DNDIFYVKEFALIENRAVISLLSRNIHSPRHLLMRSSGSSIYFKAMAPMRIIICGSMISICLCK
ncbi:MAG: hypothetical protein RQ761_06740, partial [Bacteroidales bacterium]|nr:hypothetical protein [Bacteroidales bacterium]